MNRVDVLCAMNREMMARFSRRTVNGLARHALFRLALPPFRSFLDLNVRKEVEKDRQVIARAAELLQSGAEPGAVHIAALLQQAREIDQAFLREAAVFPIAIRIRYQDIEPYRKQRIELLLKNGYRILIRWQAGGFRAAVADLYTEAQFRALLHDLLGLYATETRMLSRSVRLPRVLELARDALMDTVSETMTQEAAALAASLARRVYERQARAP